MIPKICLYVLNGKVLPPDPVSTFRRNGPLTHGLSYFTLNVIYASLGLLGFKAKFDILIEAMMPYMFAANYHNYTRYGLYYVRSMMW